VSKRHLDLLALATRLLVLGSAHDAANNIARAFMNAARLFCGTVCWDSIVLSGYTHGSPFGWNDR
jgi:hypothetical protein